MRCLAHIVNLACQDALTALKLVGDDSNDVVEFDDMDREEMDSEEMSGPNGGICEKVIQNY